jgi:hypothetical protein
VFESVIIYAPAITDIVRYAKTATLINSAFLSHAEEGSCLALLKKTLIASGCRCFVKA